MTNTTQRTLTVLKDLCYGEFLMDDNIMYTFDQTESGRVVMCADVIGDDRELEVLSDTRNEETDELLTVTVKDYFNTVPLKRDDYDDVYPTTDATAK